MCGIYGIINFTQVMMSEYMAASRLVEQGKRLEYRGYQSVGMVITTPHNTFYERRLDGCKNMQERIDKETSRKKDLLPLLGLVHTRWPTHGEATIENSQPMRSSSKGEFYIVLNGVVQNHETIRKRYPSGAFETPTDTEIISRLFMDERRAARRAGEKLSFVDLCRRVVDQCKGDIAIAALSKKHFPNQMVAYTRGMPLLVGFSVMKTESDFRYRKSRGQTITAMPGYAEIASDEYGFSGDVKSVYTTKDNDIVYFNKKRITISSPVAKNDLFVFKHVKNMKKIKHLYHMEAEIYDQPKALARVLKKYLIDGSPHFKIKPKNILAEKDLPTKQGISLVREGLFAQNSTPTRKLSVLKKKGILTKKGALTRKGLSLAKKGVLHKLSTAQHFYFLACGTSYNACKAVESMFIELLGIQPHVMLASDFTDMKYPISRENIYVFVSQSGETGDVMKAQERCTSNNATTIAFTNRKRSAIHKRATLSFDIKAGPEIGVASTKAYTCQYLTLAMFAAFLADKKGVDSKITKRFVKHATRLPELVKKTLKSYDSNLTKYIFNRPNILILSRGSGYSIALEGALKILEVSYATIKPISTAELDHGTLAIVDKDLHTMVIVPNESDLCELTATGVDRLITCGSSPFVFVSKSNKGYFEEKEGIKKLALLEDTHHFVQGILSIIPFQLAAYHSCLLSGRNPDRPKNLAKCVSVK